MMYRDVELPYPRQWRGMSMAQGISPGTVAIPAMDSLSIGERVRVREYLCGAIGIDRLAIFAKTNDSFWRNRVGRYSPWVPVLD